MRCFLFALCLAWHVQAMGSEWLYLKGPDNDGYEKLVDGSKVSFKGPELEFEYLIERERAEDRGEGAILVCVVRKYGPNWEKESARRAKTGLTRNAFPGKKELKDAVVQRTLYEKYHKGQIENLTLRHDFHAKIPPDEYTNSPTSKLAEFLFIDPYEGQTLHRAYLIYYCGISEGGTRIPFYVGITDDFERISITVVELDSPIGVGLVSRSIEILKK